MTSEQFSDDAIKAAATPFVQTICSALVEWPASIRLSIIDWTLLEVIARQIGTVGTVEHLRILADVCEAAILADMPASGARH